MASNFVLALARVVDLACWAYFWIVIARALLSWVNPDPYNPIVRFLYRVTEPVLRPIRERLPTFALGIDFSPLVVLLILQFVQWFVVDSLRDLALTLR